MRRPLLALLVLASAPAPAQPPATPTAHAVLCPAMSGLEIGQRRSAAYETMWRNNPQKPVLGRDVNVLYTPRERRYTVNVTFEGRESDARVAALHYVFDPPPGLLAGIRDRYGPETEGGAGPDLHVWDVPSCGVRIRYRVQLSEGKRPLVEELWIDPLPAKPVRTPASRTP